MLITTGVIAAETLFGQAVKIGTQVANVGMMDSTIVTPVTAVGNSL